MRSPTDKPEIKINSGSQQPSGENSGHHEILRPTAATQRNSPPRPQSIGGFGLNPDGSLARIIEVKSLSGAWGKMGVTLSKRQLIENQERGDEFWLYVVEYASDDAKANVIPIHNPFKYAAGSYSTMAGRLWANTDRYP